MDFQLNKPLANDADQKKLDKVLTEEGAVQCVFSTQEALKVGTGTTTRRHVTKIYWYVEEVDKEEFSARQINSKHVPAGDPITLKLTELLELYLPEVEFWEERVLPAMQDIEALLEDAEIDREDGKFYSAKNKFNHALTIEEKNVRALFNLGLIYLQLDEKDKARDMMNELLKLKTPFVGRDQHLFNDLGIALRKNGLFEEAVAYYTRATEFIQDDEHLFYNLSRVNYERGDWSQCVLALKTCRQLNPDLKPALDLADILLELSNDDAICKNNGKPVIPNDVAAQINELQAIRPTGSTLSKGQEAEVGRARTVGALHVNSEDLDI